MLRVVRSSGCGPAVAAAPRRSTGWQQAAARCSSSGSAGSAATSRRSSARSCASPLGRRGRPGAAADRGEGRRGTRRSSSSRTATARARSAAPAPRRSGSSPGIRVSGVPAGSCRWARSRSAHPSRQDTAARAARHWTTNRGRVSCDGSGNQHRRTSGHAAFELDGARAARLPAHNGASLPAGHDPRAPRRTAPAAERRRSAAVAMKLRSVGRDTLSDLACSSCRSKPSTSPDAVP